MANKDQKKPETKKNRLVEVDKIRAEAIHRFHMAFSLMTIIPLFICLYLVTARFYSIELITGLNTVYFLFIMTIAILGHIFGLEVVLGIVKRLRSSTVELEKLTGKLKISRRSFMTLVDKNVDGLIVIDMNNIVCHVNPAAEMLLNKTHNSLIGISFEFPLSTEKATEVEIKDESGRKRIVEMRVVKTSWQEEKGQEGDIYLASLRDITDRKNTELELRATNKSLFIAHEKLKRAQMSMIQRGKMESIGRLAAGVAHEVKNPLAVIQMGTDYLSGHIPPEDKKTFGVVAEMEDAVKRASKIIHELLEFSKPKEILLKPQDLNEVILRSFAMIKHEIDKNSVMAVKEFDGDIHPVLIDAQKIEQVFINLFLNSIHAMPEGGKITVKTYTKEMDKLGGFVGRRETDLFSLGEKAAVIEISDEGPGIPQENIDKIFDPFFTTKPAGKGTGLGLSIAKNIVDMHKGHIDVQAKKGSGTRIVIHLRFK